MLMRFKNGSYIETIDAPENKRATAKELDMSDVDWFCSLHGINLYPWQKAALWFQCHNEIRRMRSVVEKLGSERREFNGL